jgi:hypothetical protein
MVTEITLMYLTSPTGVQRWRDSLLTEAVERRAGLKGGLKERNKNHYICTMKAAMYNRGGQADLYKMIESYMNGGKVYENGGGPIEDSAVEPGDVRELMDALKALSSRGGNPLTGREVKERMSELKSERRTTADLGDFRDPRLMFNRSNSDYQGTNAGFAAGKGSSAQRKAGAYYDDKINRLGNQAWATKASQDKTSLPPRLREGEFAEILARMMESGQL